MKVADVIASVRDGLAAGKDDKPGEGLLCGRRDDAVGRILVCQTPSVAVLRVAALRRRTLVISREHPFYVHDASAWSTRVDADLKAANDPVLLGKQRMVTDAGIACYRLSSAWDAARPKAMARALAQALGWEAGESRRAGGGGDRREAICDIPPVTLPLLAQIVRDRLDAGHVRVTGSREAVVRRVALMPEFLTVSDVRALVAAKLGINAVICGESCEWEAAVYLKDALDTKGAPVSVIFAGHQPTQAPGVRAMYQWLKQRFPDVPTELVETVRPVRRLEQRA